MKTLFRYIILLFTALIFSQNRTDDLFLFNNQEIEYTRIDYSKYGKGQFIVTMFNKNSKNEKIKANSIGCLRNRKKLYHTLYFFLEIPKTIKDEYKKTELFTAFIEHLKNKEEIDVFDLYLNFDINYSIPYQFENKNVKKTTTDINPKTICRNLTTR